MSTYIPLVLPSIGSPTNFTATANFLSSAATALVNSGNSYIQSLTDLKDTDFYSVGTLPQFPGLVFSDVTLQQIGDRPVRPDIDLNVQGMLDRLLALTAPAAPDTSAFDYSDPGYVSTLRDPLINKLLVDLANGGYGIDNNDEIALYNRARDREALAGQTAIDEAKRTASGFSFGMPQGSLFTSIQRARQEAQMKDSSINRDIMLNRSKLYVENRQFIIEKVLAHEGLNINLYNSIQNRAQETSKLMVQMAIAVYEQGLRFFQFQIDALMKNIDATIDAAKIDLALYTTDVSAYAAFVNAVSLISSQQVANSRLILDATKHQYDARADIVKFKLQQLMTTVDNAKSINQFGTEFFRTALGAAMNGISGLSVQTGTT